MTTTTDDDNDDDDDDNDNNDDDDDFTHRDFLLITLIHTYFKASQPKKKIKSCLSRNYSFIIRSDVLLTSMNIL